MKNLHKLNAFRVTSGPIVEYYGGTGDATSGAFVMRSPIDCAELKIIASCNGGWDHVSVSRKNRPPNWAEMSFVHRWFFEESETAMQLHVPKQKHINNMPNCLHLWRPHNVEIPLPPEKFV